MGKATSEGENGRCRSNRTHFSLDLHLFSVNIATDAFFLCFIQPSYEKSS